MAQSRELCTKFEAAVGEDVGTILRLRDIASRVTELPYFKNARIEALVRDAKDALAIPPSDRAEGV